jgi:hypothetical protein
MWGWIITFLQESCSDRKCQHLPEWVWVAQPVATSCPETGLQQLFFGLEYTRRLSIFAHNLAQAQRLQQEDLGTAEFGETPFSDLTGTRVLG